jgi:hypothetical protein
MTLPELLLSTSANQTWQFSGLDHINNCLDKDHFLSYPYDIIYKYNSRGFRDQEWPISESDLRNSIWCVGDSFTVGLGSPREHTWPFLLQQQTNTRTINISMDGASNEWISRQVQLILSLHKPGTIVIQWSYIHRRERNIESVIEERWKQFYNRIKDSTWPDQILYQQRHLLPLVIQHEIENDHDSQSVTQIIDENRRLYSVNSTDEQDINNLIDCVNSVENIKNSTVLIHSFVPGFISAALHNNFFDRWPTDPTYCIEQFPILDLARDGHHYDLLTADNLVKDKILHRLR